MDLTKEEEQRNNKLESLGSAIIAGDNMIKQLEGQRSNYKEMFEEQQTKVTNPRIKALHSIVFNTNLNSYEKSLKTLNELLTSYKEELENETKNSVSNS